MGRLFRFSTAVFLGFLAQPTIAAGQSAGSPPTVPRGDASGSVGWFAAHEEPSNAYSYDRRYNSWHGSMSFGYYWTENFKTELEGGLTSEGTVWATPVRRADGAFTSARHKFSTRSFAVGQQYQFGHNAWFHPHLAAGVLLEWVRHTEEREPIYLSLRTPPYSVVLDPARKIGPTTDLRAVPFMGGGFKAYMSERAFFRTDLRLALEPEVKDVTLKFGFGFDF